MRNGNLILFFDQKKLSKSSYPTYEEWKLQYSLKSRKRAYIVLILPMRNGNSISSPTLICVPKVLILPMRNGNNISFVPTDLPLNVLILPMRNGNYKEDQQ